MNRQRREGLLLYWFLAMTICTRTAHAFLHPRVRAPRPAPVDRAAAAVEDGENPNKMLDGLQGIRLRKPLGITFEECMPGKAEGVRVGAISEGGYAEEDGRILVGDKLVAVSAVLFRDDQRTLAGQKIYNNWKREMITVTKEEFSVIMAAISSNSPRFGYKDIVLQVRRTDDSVPRSRQLQERKGINGDGS